MKPNSVKTAAKKSFMAFKNPYHSVKKVFPQIINHVNDDEEYFYTGVKDVPQIPHELLTHLENKGNYLLHTLDSHTMGGRAIDTQRINPISGRLMTGSSSGTAINVLTGINDLGIGTDGGGSVLAPAISVNLFGFISPLICKEYLEGFVKKSTDNISFTPSIGYITRSYEEMKRVIHKTLDLPKTPNVKMNIGLINKTQKDVPKPTEKYTVIELSKTNLLGSREFLIDFLQDILPNFDFIISEEGPIDFYGLGDSVLGHFDDKTKKEQEYGNKGLVRVVNMVEATAISIPKSQFASAYTLICQSSPNKISKMIDFAENLITPESQLIDRYFRSFDHYFSEGFLDFDSEGRSST